MERKIKRGTQFVLYCDSCPFELAPNVDTVRRCPHCNEWLKTWSLDRGNGGPKRKGLTGAHLKNKPIG